MAVGDKCFNENCAEGFEDGKAWIPEGRIKYCSDRCRLIANRLRYNRKTRAAARVDLELIPDRGPIYEKAVEMGIAPKLLDGSITALEAKDQLESSISMVYRVQEQYRRDTLNLEAADDWRPLPSAQDLLLGDFGVFRHNFFEVSPGVPYVTKPFHNRWIAAIEKALQTGGQLGILSPPRHSKTDTLIHYCIREIIKDPDIHIVWIGKNERQARKSVRSVMDQLEHNRPLRELFMPPGRLWRPEKRGGTMWSASEFHVANQTVVGDKSPTMRAVGRQGQILSSDVDLIIADDIEDHTSVMQEGARENTRLWWTTSVGSRIEANTASVVIGSRQHPEDLYQHLIDNPSWDMIVEEAHSSECELDPGRLGVHIDCMLWPEKNSYEWLMGRRLAAQTTGGLATYEMVYLNKTRAAMSLTFNRDDVEACWDYDRPIGHIPEGTYRIAGLDPATSGYQASFLWAFDFEHQKEYMVDTENDKAGGMAGAARIIKDWFYKYELCHWVIEENGWQQAIRKDRDLLEWCANHGVRLDGHQTYKNKWHRTMGVTSMQSLFEDHKVSFPYQGAEAQEKTDMVARQLGSFSDKRPQTRALVQSDLVMAMWFPQKKWHKEMQIQVANMGVQYDPVYADFPALEVTM